MLIYSHNTPEILTASFRNKQQVKNSSFCNLVDDNLPDDVMSLKGDDLIIKEGTNTLNVDIALAIAFNNIKDRSSAYQFGKLLIANGPNIDTRTIKYYTRRIKTGPFGVDVINHFTHHFNYINGTYTGNSIGIQQDIGKVIEPNIQSNSGDQTIDNSFVGTLKKLLENCLSAPCNYFRHSGSYGFLANAPQTLNTLTNIRSDVLNNTQGVGVHDMETFGRMPTNFQKVSMGLNQLTTTTANKFIMGFNDGANRSLLGGNILSPDSNTYQAYGKAQSNVLFNLANSLGDCFRMDDYRKRYNPFSYYSKGGPNGEVTAPPGISGMPVGFNIVRNNLLNSSINGYLRSFTTNTSWYIPGGNIPIIGGILNSVTSNQYTLEDYLEGKSQYVSVSVDSNILPYGTRLYNTTQKYQNKLIPFVVSKCLDNLLTRVSGQAITTLLIATRDKSSKPDLGKQTWTIAGGPDAAIIPSETNVVQQYNPNTCKGISNTGNFNKSTPGRGIKNATSFANKTDLRRYYECIQKNGSDCLKKGDNGQGYFGKRTDGSIPMCALPTKIWMQAWGSKQNASSKKVNVGFQGKQVVCELADTLTWPGGYSKKAGKYVPPDLVNETRPGTTYQIDLNPAALLALGVDSDVIDNDQFTGFVEWSWVDTPTV